MRRLFSLLGPVALAGCSFAPAYRPPTITPPTAYKEIAPVVAAGWTQADPADLRRGAWWSVFADPVLDGLEAQVEQASPTLAAALARYDAARAAVSAARANLLPEVDVGASVERDRVSAERPLSNGTAVTYNRSILRGATLSYEVDLWGRVRNEVAARRAESAASAADLANVRLSLQNQLADAYFRLRGSDAQQGLLRRTVAAYSRAQDLTVTRHEGGIANGLDVNRARNLLSNAKSQIASVASQRAAVEHQIAALTGQVASTFAIPPVDGLAAPPLLPITVPSALLQHRPDVATAERRVFAANARIGVARAAYFPTITLGGVGGFDATQGSLLSNPATYWAVGPAQALLAVFDGGRRRAQVRISRAQYDETAANYRTTVLQAFREVEDGLAATRLLAQASVDQFDAATAAQRTEDLALVRYREGASTYLDVVTAQTATLAAQQTALSLQTQRLQATVALIRALGGDYAGPPG